MTFVELEGFLDEMAFKSVVLKSNGIRLNPQETRIECAKLFPDKSSQLWDGIECGNISLVEYRAGWERIIRNTKSMLFISKIETILLPKT